METIDVRDISYGNLVACDTWKNVLEKGEDFKWHHGGETHSPQGEDLHGEKTSFEWGFDSGGHHFCCLNC